MLAFGQKNIEMYYRVEWPLVVLHSSLREVLMFRRSEVWLPLRGNLASHWQFRPALFRLVLCLTPAAWQWLTELFVAVAFPGTWQWPIKRIRDIFLTGASVTP